MKGYKSMRKVYITFFVLLCAFLATFFGLVFAKYVKQQELNNSLIISAELGKVVLQEHYAERQADGSYVLTDEVIPNAINESNSYKLMPGVDVPKDPFITVDKVDNTLPAYVYLKVQSTIQNENIEYVIDAQNWIPVGEPVTVSKVTTSYYVYTGGTGSALAVTSNITDVNIIQDKKIAVGRDLLHDELDAQQLVFSSAIFQTASGTDAVDVFNKNRGTW